MIKRTDKTQHINVGNTVQVMNQKPDGTPIIEGDAKILGVDYRDIHGLVYCSVLFEGDESPVYRWIDPSIYVSM